MWMKTRPRPEKERQKLGTHLRNFRALQKPGLEPRREEGWEATGAGWQPVWHVDGHSSTGDHPTGRPEVVYVLRGEKMPGAGGISGKK